jgi:hypothetical protein
MLRCSDFFMVLKKSGRFANRDDGVVGMPWHPEHIVLTILGWLLIWYSKNTIISLLKIQIYKFLKNEYVFTRCGSTNPRDLGMKFEIHMKKQKRQTDVWIVSVLLLYFCDAVHVAFVFSVALCVIQIRIENFISRRNTSFEHSHMFLIFSKLLDLNFEKWYHLKFGIIWYCLVHPTRVNVAGNFFLFTIVKLVCISSMNIALYPVLTESGLVLSWKNNVWSNSRDRV